MIAGLLPRRAAVPRPQALDETAQLGVVEDARRLPLVEISAPLAREIADARIGEEPARVGIALEPPRGCGVAERVDDALERVRRGRIEADEEVVPARERGEVAAPRVDADRAHADGAVEQGERGEQHPQDEAALHAAEERAEPAIRSALHQPREAARPQQRAADEPREHEGRGEEQRPRNGARHERREPAGEAPRDLRPEVARRKPPEHRGDHLHELVQRAGARAEDGGRDEERDEDEIEAQGDLT